MVITGLASRAGFLHVHGSFCPLPGAVKTLWTHGRGLHSPGTVERKADARQGEGAPLSTHVPASSRRGAVISPTTIVYASVPTAILPNFSVFCPGVSNWIDGVESTRGGGPFGTSDAFSGGEWETWRRKSHYSGSTCFLRLLLLHGNGLVVVATWRVFCCQGWGFSRKMRVISFRGFAFMQVQNVHQEPTNFGVLVTDKCFVGYTRSRKTGG